MRKFLVILLALPGVLAAQGTTPATPRAMGLIREADLRRDLFATLNSPAGALSSRLTTSAVGDMLHSRI